MFILCGFDCACELAFIMIYTLMNHGYNIVTRLDCITLQFDNLDGTFDLISPLSYESNLTNVEIKIQLCHGTMLPFVGFGDHCKDARQTWGVCLLGQVQLRLMCPPTKETLELSREFFEFLL